MKQMSVWALLLFCPAVLQASAEQLANAVEIARALGQSVGSGAAVLLPNVYNIPLGPQNQCSNAICNFTGVFNPVNATNGPLYAGQNGNPISCSKQLNFLNIGFTDSTGANFYSIEFQEKDFSLANISPLLNPGAAGIYIAMNLVQAGGNNYIHVLIMNPTNNAVLAQAVSAPIVGGIVSANIGFNMHDTLHQAGANQKRLNGVKLSLGQRVWYKQVTQTVNTGQQPDAQTTITSPTENQFPGPYGSWLPIAPSPQVVPKSGQPVNNQGPQIYKVPAGNIGCSDTICNFTGNFTPVNATSGPVYSAQAGHPVSVQDGLKFINVGLTDSNQKYFYSVVFDATALSQPSIANLLQNGAAGIYIAVNLIQQNNENFAQVLLTDQSGNILAQAQTGAINGGLTYANIGFNKNDTRTAIKPGQTVINNLPIAQGERVWYQQLNQTVNNAAPGQAQNVYVAKGYGGDDDSGTFKGPGGMWS